MINIFFKIFVIFLLYACADKSLIISEDRDEVFPANQKLIINEEAASENFDLGPEISNTTYTHLGFNKSRSGGHLSGPKSNLKTVWSKDIGKGTNKNSPSMPNLIGKNDFIYAMDTTGKLTSLNAKSGRVEWSITISDRENSYTASSGGLSIYNNNLYAHLGGLNLVALNSLTGEMLWEKNFNVPIISGPTSNSKGVFITLIDGTLKFLFKENGELIWERKVISNIDDVMSTASVSVNKDTVVVPDFGGGISVLALEDGSYLWEDNLALLAPKTAIEQLSTIKAEPSIFEGKIFVVAQNGRLASYDLNNSKMVWEKSISSNQVIWIAGSSIFAISDKAELICLRKVDGSIRWITKLPSKIDQNLMRYQKFIPHFGPVVGSNKVYVAGSDKKLRVFNYKDGKLIEEKKFSNSFSTPPILINSTLYILDDNAKLFAFE